jgi:MoaA/NifB/PqqE/SkfB family radical SAM enzyme
LKFNPTRFAVVDKDGNLKFPPEIKEAFCLTPEMVLRVVIGEDEIQIKRSSDHLARVYIEPTNRCNLECLTCIRNVWDEPLGMMQWETFEWIMDGIQAFEPIPTIFFGGFGEPFVHPEIIEMIRKAKDLGAAVELITNGILLTEDISEQLIETGLDVLWISIDGVKPESYADVRLGATLPNVLENLDSLLKRRDLAIRTKPQVGIAFVAMKRNIQELPDLLTMGVLKGIELFSISNVLAYTAELKEEVMYERTLIEGSYQSASRTAEISFPRMDVSNQTLAAYQKAIQNNYHFRMSGNEVDRTVNKCPFLLKGSTSIRWDGEISPCLPLLHTHECYLGKRLRRSRAYSFGNILDSSLAELWNNPGYIALRQRLQAFDFSPCTYCNSCEMADENQDDCFGNSAPACGGCLWAQGLIQCP